MELRVLDLNRGLEVFFCAGQVVGVAKKLEKIITDHESMDLRYDSTIHSRYLLHLCTRMARNARPFLILVPGRPATSGHRTCIAVGKRTPQIFCNLVPSRLTETLEFETKAISLTARFRSPSQLNRLDCSMSSRSQILTTWIQSFW